MTTVSRPNHTFLIVILGLLTAIGPLSIDMYLPAFPVIAENLHTTVEQVGYSLSAFFIGVCAGQFLSGPLLDRYGRKKPLYAGLTLYIIASVGCALSGTVIFLIGFRFLQALGGCVAMITPAAVVRDVFPVEKSASVFSLLILILGVSPILAPTLGGLLASQWGWQPIFIVLAIICLLILLLVIFYLPNTYTPNPALSLRPKAILGNFREVIKEQQFITYSLSGNIAAAGLFAYLAGSPFVFMNIFQVSQQQYGWIFGLIAAGLITCSQLNNVLLKKYNSAQILKVVQFVQVCFGILLLGGTLGHLFNLYGFITVTLLFLSCQGFTFPNSAAMAMAPFSTNAGSASALMGSMQMALGALASALVGLFFNGTALPLIIIMTSCCLCGFLLLLAGQKKLKWRSQTEMRELADEQAMELLEKY
jgi:DHA1 family bicyclomycin/chloramphenicol resistance-like MFS transporter